MNLHRRFVPAAGHRRNRLPNFSDSFLTAENLCLLDPIGNHVLQNVQEALVHQPLRAAQQQTFSINRRGEGWYFSHGGSNFGFQCILLAHKVKGYGLVVMTNAHRGGVVMQEVSRRIQEAYEWDSIADPVPRG